MECGGGGIQGYPWVLEHLNKVNLVKPLDQMCRQDGIALCSVTSLFCVNGFYSQAISPRLVPTNNLSSSSIGLLLDSDAPKFLFEFIHSFLKLLLKKKYRLWENKS